ncbi:13453_t:CDS:2 [Gigaspora margarita]|uniref:13453_t:CDS:1 n=1 Tax=Gigaspora margarita TaxID=4874 RepID=A0ABN7UAL0_GIGMA|nr:13453_t:CDS:2 [Gigaspora margarita]
MPDNISCNLKEYNKHAKGHPLKGKPENILMNGLKPLITDFGSSFRTDDSLEIKVRWQDYAFTFEYVDPQVFLEPDFVKLTIKSDIYALGIIFWQLSSGKLPYLSISHPTTFCYTVACENYRDEPVSGTPRHYIALYNDCWNTDPETRLYTDEVLQRIQPLKNEKIEFIENKLHSRKNEELSYSISSITSNYLRLIKYLHAKFCVLF